MTPPGALLAVLGATGAVGEEILRLLAERRFPLEELRVFASEFSEGGELEFGDTTVRVEAVSMDRVVGCDLVISAAPGVLEPLLPELRASGTRIVDVTGTLELDAAVPLFLPGRERAIEEASWVAVPRGIVFGLAVALAPLAREVELERVTVLTLESASGAGRPGLDEFSSQMIHVLNAMDGDLGESEVFPQALAFDCLPAIGAVGANDETSEEQRLRDVLRRALERPRLAIESTRVRVPIFTGSLACVHLQLAKELAPGRAEELWEQTAGVRVVGSGDLPTPRTAAITDDVTVGRIRSSGEGRTGLAFVVALDTLRRGAALSAVEVAELLLSG